MLTGIIIGFVAGQIVGIVAAAFLAAGRGSDGLEPHRLPHRAARGPRGPRRPVWADAARDGSALERAESRGRVTAIGRERR